MDGALFFRALSHAFKFSTVHGAINVAGVSKTTRDVVTAAVKSDPGLAAAVLRLASKSLSTSRGKMWWTLCASQGAWFADHAQDVTQSYEDKLLQDVIVLQDLCDTNARRVPRIGWHLSGVIISALSHDDLNFEVAYGGYSASDARVTITGPLGNAVAALPRTAREGVSAALVKRFGRPAANAADRVQTNFQTITTAPARGAAADGGAGGPVASTLCVLSDCKVNATGCARYNTAMKQEKASMQVDDDSKTTSNSRILSLVVARPWMDSAAGKVLLTDLAGDVFRARGVGVGVKVNVYVRTRDGVLLLERISVRTERGGTLLVVSHISEHSDDAATAPQMNFRKTKTVLLVFSESEAAGEKG